MAAEDRPPTDDRTGHQGLDLGAGPAVPGVRLRRRRVAGPEIGDRVRANAAAWQQVLGRPDVATGRRPACGRRWSTPATSSTCTASSRHGLALMLAEDDPLFENWDQDATAIAGRYAEQDPATVAGELSAAAAASAARFDAVSGAEWTRTGRRSDGAVFTVESLGRYFVHDWTHHLRDVGAAAAVSDHGPRAPRRTTTTTHGHEPRARARRRPGRPAAAPGLAAQPRRGGGDGHRAGGQPARHPGAAALLRRADRHRGAAGAWSFLVSGSVALLVDTLHNVADALTAVPHRGRVHPRPAGRDPPLHLRLRPGRGPGRASSWSLVIAASAVLAAYEAVRRLLDPQRRSTTSGGRARRR